MVSLQAKQLFSNVINVWGKSASCAFGKYSTHAENVRYQIFFMYAENGKLLYVSIYFHTFCLHLQVYAELEWKCRHNFCLTSLLLCRKIIIDVSYGGVNLCFMF